VARRRLPQWVAHLDRLRGVPTIDRGARELGIRDLRDWLVWPRRISTKPSRYTHPLLRPIIYVPGLRAVPFYERSDFAWVRAVEAQADVIRGELAQPPGRRAGFSKYLVSEDQETVVEAWKTFSFVSAMGQRNEENIKRCPRTWQLLNAIPGFIPFNMTMFSALDGSGRIYPHTGLSNMAIRCHLPLRVEEPTKAVIRVGPDVRTWEEGCMLLFNDAFDHEVWNFGSTTRIVLFFDVWHPDLTPADLEVLVPLYRDRIQTTAEEAQAYEARVQDLVRDFADEKEWSER
jgi:aspartate beta-hydroxylase